MEFKVTSPSSFQFSISLEEFLERYHYTEEVFLCLFTHDLMCDAFRDIPNLATTEHPSGKTLRLATVFTFGISTQLQQQWMDAIGDTNHVINGLGSFNSWNQGTEYGMLSILGIDEGSTGYDAKLQREYRINAMKKCIAQNPDFLFVFNLSLNYGDKFKEIGVGFKFMDWLNGLITRCFS